MSATPTAPSATAAHDAFAETLANAVTPAAYLDAAHPAVFHAATLAPSAHNSQPWSLIKDDGGADLYADDARRLPVLDPEGRLVYLSWLCAGQALGLVGTPRLALRLGYAARTAATPRRDVNDVLAHAAAPDGPDA